MLQKLVVVANIERWSYRSFFDKLDLLVAYALHW